MKKKQRVLVKKIGIVVLLVLLVILIRGVWGGQSALKDAKERQSEQASEFAHLDERIAGLESQITHLGTKEGKQDELIETFPIKRPGEEVVILIENKEGGAGFIEKKEEKKSWWQFWKR